MTSIVGCFAVTVCTKVAGEATLLVVYIANSDCAGGQAATVAILA